VTNGIAAHKPTKKTCRKFTLFGLGIQGYQESFRDFFDACRPSVCPICGWAHPLQVHGTYSRFVYDRDLDWQEIGILRYYCPGCGKTVSILPEFLTPCKRYSLEEISRVFYLHFVLEMSLCLIFRSLLSATLSTICGWVKSWSSSCGHLVLKGFVEAGITSSGEHFPG